MCLCDQTISVWMGFRIFITTSLLDFFKKLREINKILPRLNPHWMKAAKRFEINLSANSTRHHFNLKCMTVVSYFGQYQFSIFVTISVGNISTSHLPTFLYYISSERIFWMVWYWPKLKDQGGLIKNSRDTVNLLTSGKAVWKACQ